ncbi:MAG: thioesterase family protein [Gammaproteobacteria bacterium]
MAVRWGDMDALGHVNNTVYFRYCESARVGWLASVGHAIEEGPTGPVVVNASCTFHTPIVYPAEIAVEMFAGNPGRSSFDTWYEIRPADRPDPLYAEGASRVVWVDHTMGRSVPIPEEIRRLVES